MKNLKHGFFLLAKPRDISSSQLVLEAKKISRKSKVGHTGTLDSFAEGVMVLPFGGATVLSSLFLHGPKTYQAYFRWGTYTDSGDATGKLLRSWEADKMSEIFLQRKEELQASIQEIAHWKTQTAPEISALKQGGKRHSDLFRKGKATETRTREIWIRNLKTWDWSENGFWLELEVASGTYIRKIAQDWSEVVQIPLHVERLIRVRGNQISIDQCQTLKDFRTQPKEHSIAEVLGIPQITLSPKEITEISFGRRPELPHLPEGICQLVEKGGDLIALVERNPSSGEFQFLKVFLCAS